MFFGSLKEGDVVEMADSYASAFKEFLQLIYLPEITFTLENVEEVVRLVDKYDMSDCLDLCVSFLHSKLTSENALLIYRMAILLENSTLKAYCEKVIRKFTKDVLKSKGFLHCERKVVEHILKMNESECSELELFNACIKWAISSCQRNKLDENCPKNLKNELGNCFYLIRFGAMNGKEICEILSNKVYKRMFYADELIDLMRTKFDETFRSEILKYEKRLMLAKKPIEWQRSGLNGNCFLNTQESVWFSISKYVFLIRIYLGSITNGYDDNSFGSDVEIVEYNTNAFTKDAPSRIFATNTNCQIGRGYYIPLASPIAIIPRKIYEIRVVNVPNNRGHSYRYWYSDKSVKPAKIKLEGDVTITFHRDPSDVDSARRDLVSKLTFL